MLIKIMDIIISILGFVVIPTLGYFSVSKSLKTIVYDRLKRKYFEYSMGRVRNCIKSLNKVETENRIEFTFEENVRLNQLQYEIESWRYNKSQLATAQRVFCIMLMILVVIKIIIWLA